MEPRTDPSDDEPTEVRLRSEAVQSGDPRWTELIGPDSTGFPIKVSVPSAWIVEDDDGGAPRRRIAFQVEPGESYDDLHTAGYDLGADGEEHLMRCTIYDENGEVAFRGEVHPARDPYEGWTYKAVHLPRGVVSGIVQDARGRVRIRVFDEDPDVATDRARAALKILQEHLPEGL